MTPQIKWSHKTENYCLSRDLGRRLRIFLQVLSQVYTMCGLYGICSLDSCRISSFIYWDIGPSNDAFILFFITSSMEVFKCQPWYTFFVFGFVLLPFQYYWISPRFSLPFFSSFHYKLRLLIPLLTTVSKYSAGEKIISLSVKNVQFYRSNKAQNLSPYCFWFKDKWAFLFFGEICTQCN